MGIQSLLESGNPVGKTGNIFIRQTMGVGENFPSYTVVSSFDLCFQQIFQVAETTVSIMPMIGLELTNPWL